MVYCVLDEVFGHILQSLYWMTLKSVAIPKAEAAAGAYYETFVVDFWKEVQNCLS